MDIKISCLIILYQNLKDNLMDYTNFERELQKLINIHSLENGSNTPDFLLTKYLMGCLHNFDSVVKAIHLSKPDVDPESLVDQVGFKRLLFAFPDYTEKLCDMVVAYFRQYDSKMC